MLAEEFITIRNCQQEIELLKQQIAEEVKEKYKLYKQIKELNEEVDNCLLYTSPSPRDRQKSRMPSSA